jgi:hypothetical protein
MAQNDVASSLMIYRVANFTECFDRIRGQNKQANGSHANFDDGFGDWSRNRFAVFFQTLEIALNGVTNIRHHLVARFPLGNTAGQSRAFGNKNAVFIRFNRDTKFHTASVAIGGAAGNATVAIVSPTEDSGRYNTTGVRGKEEEG